MRSARRMICLIGVSLLAGCPGVQLPGDLSTFLVAPPADETVVVGGPSNTQPYFGRARKAILFGQETGDFLLASCGCGEWKVLFTPDDGSPRSSFDVEFFSKGAYVPTGTLDVYGTEGDQGLSGQLDQDTGALVAKMLQQSTPMLANAQRGEQHTDSVKACVTCHVGADSVFPQPPNHPAFRLDPPNCLDCHTVNGQ